MGQQKNIPRRTIFNFFFQTSWRLCALSVSITALILMTVNFIALRSEVLHNLHLVGKSIAYSAEAAIVFKDRPAAEYVIQKIIQTEAIWKITVYSSDDKIFTQLETPSNDFLLPLLPQSLIATHVEIPVLVDGLHLERIVVENDGRQILQYSYAIFSAGFITILLLLSVARYLAHKNARHIKNKLHILTHATQSVIQNQDFSTRVPSMRIAEFHQLGQDFNELLHQLEILQENQRQQQQRLEVKNETLSQQAIQDSLTQLYNRRGFEQAMVEQIANAQRLNQKIGVLYLDNDKFKRINDEYGHAVGDALLIDVGRRIRQVTRDTDFVARVGGDEFAILLPRLRSAQDALRVAQKIIDAMAQPLVLNQGNIQIIPGVSIGIAIYPEHGQNPETLSKAADQAMYAAKQNGRGQWQIFNAENLHCSETKSPD